MVPGIDFAGTVAESSSADWKRRRRRRHVRMGHRRGAVGRPRAARSCRRVVAHRPSPTGGRPATRWSSGTAGFTAALSVAVRRACRSQRRARCWSPGASGGVGSFSIMLLAAAGYDVIAGTTTPDAAGYLNGLGATEIVDSRELGADVRALGKQRWAGAIDNVGGSVLAGVISSTSADGTVAACRQRGRDGPPHVGGAVHPPRRCRSSASRQCGSRATARRDAWRPARRPRPRERLDEIVEEVGSRRRDRDRGAHPRQPGDGPRRGEPPGLTGASGAPVACDDHASRETPHDRTARRAARSRTSATAISPRRTRRTTPNSVGSSSAARSSAR